MTNNIATATATPAMRGTFTFTLNEMLLLLLLLLITVVVETEEGVVVSKLALEMPSTSLQIHRTHLCMGLMETRGHRGGFSGVAHPHVLYTGQKPFELYSV